MQPSVKGVTCNPGILRSFVIIVVQSCPTLCNPMVCSKPGFPVLNHLPEFCSNSCPSSQWCHPTIPSSVVPFSSCLQSSPASGSISNQSALCLRWPKYWSFSFSISPFNEYSELISFRIDWFDLLVVQGPLKSLLQHHKLKTSVLKHSTFFMVQLSHIYMTTGKTIALARQTFVSKMMSLLFNTLSRLVILPRIWKESFEMFSTSLFQCI